MFGQSMPLAALINWATNALEIILRYKNMYGYAKRIKAEGAQGIGVWLNIVE